MSLRLPDSLHRRVAELAKRDNVSINKFIATAVAEKASVLAAAEYFREPGSRASRKKFEAVRARVPAAQPEAQDRLSNMRLQRPAANRAAKSVRRGRNGGDR